jgi:hypothetical protein
MPQRQRVVIAMTVGIAIALVAVACGETDSHPQNSPSKTAMEKGRRTCLETRESGTNAWRVAEGFCQEFGVTNTQPPPMPLAESPDVSTEPVMELQRRAAAILDYSQGNETAARRELREGCPTSSPDELREAWSRLQKADESAHTVADLERASEEFCPE